LEHANRTCNDGKTEVNDSGDRRNVFSVEINEPIRVGHKYQNTPLERINFWMHIGHNLLSSSELLYIPGRTIVFDDFNKALLYIGIKNYSILKSNGFTKESGMRALNNVLGKQYESMVFRQHLDGWRSCNHRCCVHGSELHQEMVALRKWNMFSCPSHPNLSWIRNSCNCTSYRFC
jgi:hypothetical protein